MKRILLLSLVFVSTWASAGSDACKDVRVILRNSTAHEFVVDGISNDPYYGGAGDIRHIKTGDLLPPAHNGQMSQLTATSNGSWKTAHISGGQITLIDENHDPLVLRFRGEPDLHSKGKACNLIGGAQACPYYTVLVNATDVETPELVLTITTADAISILQGLTHP